MKKEEKIKRLRNTISELEDRKLPLEIAIIGLQVQLRLEEIKEEQSSGETR